MGTFQFFQTFQHPFKLVSPCELGKLLAHKRVQADVDARESRCFEVLFPLSQAWVAGTDFF
jgi:hypothetical protein